MLMVGSVPSVSVPVAFTSPAFAPLMLLSDTSTVSFTSLYGGSLLNVFTYTVCEVSPGLNVTEVISVVRPASA